MKLRYNISNLDCANCANKIECALNKDKKINKAVVNFSKLSVMVDTDINKNVKSYVQKIIDKTEPGVMLLDKKESFDIKKKVLKDVLRLAIGIVLALLGTYLFKDIVSNILIILGYVVLLFRTASNAVKLIFKSKTIDENLLVTISCVGAYFTNNISEGLMVIVLYEIGKILEEIAVNRSRKSISDLMDIKPEYANLKTKEDTIKVSPEDVKKGDVILIKKGEKVPLDGIIIEGDAKLNIAALTGESTLRKASVNDEVLSGSVNEDGTFLLKVTSLYDDSTVAKILNLVESAGDRKAKTETFVSKAAKIYTPVVLILAILITIFLPLLFNVDFNDAIYRALVFLVISCPCAIAISVPLSYFSGIGRASKDGILIKGSDYLDALGHVNEIIFDKTGTITTGKASSYKLDILNKDYKKEDVINYYLKAEKLSNHPIAVSIVNIFNKTVKTDDVKDFKEVSGKGVSCTINGNKVKVGSSKFCKSKEDDNGIYLNVNDKVVAKLELVDGIKEGVKDAINELKSEGITVKMFTGDNKDVTLSIAGKVGIDNVCYELLPEDKYNLLEKEIRKSNVGKTAFVGDGINDAPSLALADVGISMGGVGQASAIEASDVVIMTDDVSKINDGIKISKKTSKIIKQNLVFAIGVKVLVLILSALGIASMWQAVFADTGVTLLTILNTTRILKK